MTGEPPAGELSPPDHLPAADWLHAPATGAVVAALEAEGGAGVARYVGGSVRDTLLRLPAALDPAAETSLDIDIATSLPPPRVLAALERAGLKAVPTGIAHGTVTAISRGRPYEITTLRRDVETDGRYAVVAFTDDWAQDAARRDFRLNALYAEPDGRLHDPTGGGIADALAGRIVFVGDAATRIAEDYLRILRFFRFQAWYGRGEPDVAGLAACAALAEGIGGLSAERVAKELLKLLAALDPLPALTAMAVTGVLARLPLQADLDRLAALLRVERALDVQADPALRLAALSSGDVSELAVRLRLSNSLRDRLAAADGALEGPAGMTQQLGRRRLYELGRVAFRDRLLLRLDADEAEAARPLLALAEAWTAPAFPLSGEEIKAAGVAQGPGIGRVRREVEAWWIASDFPQDRAALHAALRAAVGHRDP
ncbi:CCA tRNA nucleotidyltransferase [Caulobacter sp. S45]|uniref:CCA tRNA nucleotidyltransferase n=1 Tax=Caulobacter sp. S45 TaxID=1641861 RepID=UPI001576A233|nr:CCA tRNA nucleotidyltransferase [Caulobacter sp. S45]